MTSSHFTCPEGQYAIKCPDQDRKQGQCCEWYSQLPFYYDPSSSSGSGSSHDYDDRRRSLGTTFSFGGGDTQGHARALDGGMPVEGWVVAGLFAVAIIGTVLQLVEARGLC
jgi:hypothetical protein